MHEEIAKPTIKPVSNLRNRANEISDLGHRSNIPIFITINDEGDKAVMSLAHYENL
jgi:hypothetical protein